MFLDITGDFLTYISIMPSFTFITCDIFFRFLLYPLKDFQCCALNILIPWQFCFYLVAIIDYIGVLYFLMFLLALSSFLCCCQTLKIHYFLLLYIFVGDANLLFWYRWYNKVNVLMSIQFLYLQYLYRYIHSFYL